MKLVGIIDSSILDNLEYKINSVKKENPFKTFLISFNMLSVIERG